MWRRRLAWMIAAERERRIGKRGGADGKFENFQEKA
jgi:hypothetical protein